MSLGNGSDARLDRFFNPRAAYQDFTRALRRVRHPYFPERDFFAALAKADREDTARLVKARNDQLDLDYTQRQNFRYVVRFEESDFKWLDNRKHYTRARFMKQPAAHTAAQPEEQQATG